MFNKRVLGVGLMSQVLITVEIVQIPLILIEIWYKMWWKYKKTWKCTIRKNFKAILSCQQEIPCKVSTWKKTFFIWYFKMISKNFFFMKMTLVSLNFQNKKVLKTLQFCFFTVYRVRGAVVGGNFLPIREYSSTVKNRQNCATVHHRVGVIGLRVLGRAY